MNLNTKYRVGDAYGPFTFDKVLPIQELRLILYELTHRSSGAQVMHLASEDRENLFCLSFRTLPTSSNGVAHILEHTVLCGSEKFPIKDPFFSMSRRSLSTFMNAMTGSDFTCYPASSQIEKDFYNLLEVYLDAVFSPKLHELSFRQEGHRLEFEKADDTATPLLFKGIVFNEMKGSLSSPESRLVQSVMTHLIPDLTYAHNAGGHPSEIPLLTYEELKEFHQKFYHPSRTLFFFYGNLPLENHLNFIESHALKGVKKASQLPLMPLQKRFKHPVTSKIYYPLKEKDLLGKTFTTFSWLTTHMHHQQDTLALALIESILMETDASLLKMALLKSKLCTQVDSYLDLEMGEIPYLITCYGTDPENATKLQEILFDTLHNITAQKIDQELIQAAMHQLEFSRLEITGNSNPFGLTLFFRSALAKQNGCPPENALTIYTQFKELRKRVEDPSYLSKMIRKYLIDNPHFVRLTMEPSPSLEDEELRVEQNTLKKIQDALSEESKTEIVTLAKDLKNYQKKSEKKSVDCLPKIELSDVPKDVPDFPLIHEQQDQLSIFSHECFTNHIIYADLIFDLPEMSAEELPYLQLLMSLIPELGMGKRSYQENLDYINRYLGGFSAAVHLHPQIDHPFSVKPCFSFRGKALKQHVEQLFVLFWDLCHAPRFDETERIKELILQIYTYQQSKLNQHALSYAIGRSLAHFTPSGAINQKMCGLDYFVFVRDLTRTLDKQLPLIQSKLEALCSKLIHLNTPHLVLSGDAEQHAHLSEHHYFGLGKLLPKPLDAWQDITIRDPYLSQGYIISTPVAFSAWGMQACTALDPGAPALSIATYLLENIYLHRKVREQGGAYGCGATYTPLSGHFYFYAYRDPHIAKTFAAFKTGIEKIVSGEFSSRQLEEAKLGLIQDLDAPIAPGSRGIVAYSQFRQGCTREVRQDFRDHLLNVDKKEVKAAVKNHLEKVEGVRITFSNKSLIERENLSPPLFAAPV